MLVLAGGAGALSNDGSGSWQYYRDISIYNTGAEFAYWVEEWNSTAKKGLVWVKVGSIPVGESTMRM